MMKKIGIKLDLWILDNLSRELIIVIRNYEKLFSKASILDELV